MIDTKGTVPFQNSSSSFNIADERNWISIKELLDLNIDSFPKSDKGLVKKAAREGWKKRQREGIRGKTFEYYVGDMPESVQVALGVTPTINKSKFIDVGCNLLQGKQSSRLDIPFYYTFASAGLGRVNTVKQKPDELVGVSQRWLWRTGLYKDNLLYILAEGDSMEPTIHSKDMLLIDQSATVLKDGCIYVLRVEDDLLVKRVQRTSNGIKLISDNRSLYDPIELIFDDGVNVEVLGRVVFIGHSLI